MESLVDAKAAASMLGVSPRTLEHWRREGTGPRFVAISPRCVRYRTTDLAAFVNDRSVGPPTSPPGEALGPSATGPQAPQALPDARPDA